jgi:glycosyltransferase involved in cell wall biosynthesis
MYSSLPPPLRVLTIAHNAVAASNRARTEALRKLPGVEVSLLTPRWWFEEGQRIDVCDTADWRLGRTLFTGNGTRHLYVSGLVGALRNTRPDVIDLYEEPFSVVALQTLLMRDLLAQKAALVFYSAVNVGRRWAWPYRVIERCVLRHADGAHGPNQDVPRVLRSKGLSEDRPFQIIPIGVDVDRFASAEPMSLDAIPRPRVGYVGRFEPVKGLDVLLAAFRRMTTPASLVLVGGGSQRGQLVGERAHVLPAVKYERIPSLLKALDVLVLPSVTILPEHREQFGRVLVEAMACGTPVVGSSSGAIPEVIGDAGLVVPERDPAALASAIDLVLTDADLRARLIERGRQRVASHMAWPAVAERTLELFRSALAHRRGVRNLQVVHA